MKLIIQKADNFKEVNKIIEIESTDINNNDISHFVKTNETLIIKYIDTNETFLINNIQESLKQYEGSEILLTIQESDLIPFNGGNFLSKDISTYTPATTPLAGTEKAVIHDGVSFKEVSVSEFIYTTDGKSYESLSSAMAVVPLPENNTIFYIDEANLTERGVYTYDSNEVNGYRFVRELGAKGKVEEGNTQAVSGGEVYSKSLIKLETLSGLNVYDFTKDIDAFYVSTSSGVIVSHALSSISEIYPLQKSEQVIYIKNRTGDGGFRFLDSSNQPMKALSISGVENFNYSSVLNGAFKAPIGAVSFQFTTKFNGTSNKENIIVLYDTDSEDIKIKKELIPNIDIVLETKEIADSNSLLLESILSDKEYVRLNLRENTNNPEFFPSSAETTTLIGVNVVVDTNSPTKNLLGYKREFLNTNKPNIYQQNYITESVNVSSRPTRISFGFWVNRPQFQSIFTGDFYTYLGFSAYRFPNISRIFNAETLTVNMGTAPVEYNSAKCSIREVERNGDWSRLEISYFDIDWKISFSGNSILYYFLLTGGLSYQKTLETSDWTVLFNEKIVQGIFYGDPNSNYNQNILTLSSLQNQINNLSVKKESLRVLKSGGNVYIGSSFNETQDLVRHITLNGSQNGASSLLNVKLINKGDALTSTGIILQIQGDAVPTPFQVNVLPYDGYLNIGGNHGIQTITDAVSNSHGKTSSDLLSIWKDGNNYEFYLVEILDTNSLRFASKPFDVGGFDKIIPTPQVSLTHVSGAVNTSTINISGSSYEYKPCINSIDVKLYMDDVEIIENGNYVGDVLKVIDNHNVVDPTLPTLTIPYLPQNNGTMVKNTLIHSFFNNGSYTVENITDWQKNHLLTNIGIIQPQVINKGSYDTIMTYAININNASGLDFKNGFDLSTTFPNTWVKKADFINQAKSVQQLSEILFSGSNPIIGCGFGYNPLVGTGTQEELLQNENHLLMFGSSKKYYPFAYNLRESQNKIIRGVGYYAYWDATVNPNLSADYFVPFGDSFLYFLNLRTASTKLRVKLSKELLLKEFEVVNSSDGIVLHTENSTTHEGLIVSGSVGDWCILKIR